MKLKMDNEISMKLSFKKRKSNLKKKTSQWSTLCDVNVCIVCFGSDGTVEMWPKNISDMLDLIIKYKNLSDEAREKGKKCNLPGFLEDKKRKLGKKCNLPGFLEDKKRKLGKKLNRTVDDSSSMLLKNNLAAWDERLNLFSEEELVDLCGSLDSKTIDDSSSMLLKNNLAAWDERLNLFSEEELVDLCGSLDSK
ncbi:hypothetical protein JRO89_XS03G0026600 [Xanthoceras sorbifolium]|uniref:MADS-box domain-containing protein n=1 Tax=Xanthoceras sorbifolium TaxID=99658 RepID=A0ABQ8I8A3_9ROSI|nr:hypothetical protein JRO89_XS03G0026600 [Xanthoceras sorbifolium]